MFNQMEPAFARRFKITPDWPFAISRRVEWCDLDAFSHVNHAVYFVWCEEARNKYLRDMGLPLITPTTPGVVIKTISCNYIASVGAWQDVAITVRTTSLRTTSFQMEYGIWTESGFVATVNALCVLMINETGEKVPLPASLRNTMVERDRAIVASRVRKTATSEGPTE